MLRTSRCRSWIVLVVGCVGLAAGGPARAAINGTTWLPIGPAPIQGQFTGGVSGRATAVAVNPYNVDDVWVGTAGGGVWHSLDGGAHWLATSDNEASLAIGSLALADCTAGGCSRIYAGTGENGIRRDTYYGMGLLVGSYSGGAVSWFRRTGLPTYDFKRGSIISIALVPGMQASEQVIYIALGSGVTASASESTVTASEPCIGASIGRDFCAGGYGIYKSVNNGASWVELPLPGVHRETPTDLEMDPANPDVLYAGYMGLGIYRTEDAGAHWCPMNPGVPRPWSCPDVVGLPAAHGFDHVQVLPYGSASLLATFGKCPDRLLQDCFPDVYYSSSPGTTWYPGSKGEGFLGCPNQYSRFTHGLAKDPFHNYILLGGLHLCYSPTGGVSWSANETLGPNVLQSLHLDHHAFAFHPSVACSLYEVGDGGVAYSNNCGNYWWPKNFGLQTIGFQGIGTSPRTSVILGGAQDNGGMMWKGSSYWDAVNCCGDGGFSVLDLDNAMNMYITTNVPTTPQTYNPERSLDGGANFKPAAGSIPAAEPRAFYPPLVQDPDPKQNTTQHPLYFGTNRLWKSIDDAGSWAPVSPVLSTDPTSELVSGVDVISAVAVAPSKPNHVYVGYYSGKLFTTTNACTNNVCWPAMSSGLPAAPITWIAIDPGNDDIAYATLSGFAAGIHVYRTTNGGQTWTQTASHPDLVGRVPVNTISVEPGATSRLWIGTDFGIYKSENSGQSWFRFSTGLPNVPVYQIAMDTAHDRVIAATHGRGAYMLTGPALTTNLGCVNDAMSDLMVVGNAFPANQSCTMQLLMQNGVACSMSSATDAQGGTIHTNAKGELVRTITNVVTDQPLVRACSGGKCLGFGSTAGCNPPGNPLTTVLATCGTGLGIGHVGICPSIVNPPSSELSLFNLVGGLTAPPSTPLETPEACYDPALAGGGSFQLLPSIQSADGSSRVLCSVTVPFTPSDTAGTVLVNATEEVNVEPACQASGVSAEVRMPVLEPEVEDIFPQPAGMHLLAPDLTGGVLVPSVRAAAGEATGTCFGLDNLGVPALGHLGVARVGFTTPATGALGGSLKITERSGLGECSIVVTTDPGELPAIIAGAVAAAFQAADAAGTNPDCPASVNPRDVVRSGDAIGIATASRIEVCTNDPGVGVSLAPAGICLADGDCDDGNPCTLNSCDVATGRCGTTPLQDGLPCDDQNACTTGNVCIAGTCGSPVSCGVPDPCMRGTCDPATGACLALPVLCDDLNPCTIDHCEPATGGCAFDPSLGAPCDDHDPCTVGESCVGVPGGGPLTCQGTPLCADPDPCTADLCDPLTGQCSNQPIQCEDGNPCTLDSCQSGACVSFPIAGATCDDDDRCTLGDTCLPDPAGGPPVCQGTPVACDDGDACSVDDCDPLTGGCTQVPVAEAEADGLLFTGGTTMTWSPSAAAVLYDTYRGTIPSTLLGRRPRPPYDQTCLEMGDAFGDGTLVTTDAAIPPLGTAFYYQVALVGACGEGPLGSDSNTTEIPNASPCGVVP